MNTTDVLDLIEKLLTAAGHPDIAQVEQYGQGTPQSPAGVAVTYQSGAQAFVWAVAGKPKTEPVELPEDLGPYKFRANHALKLVIDLLEAAKPAGIGGWRTVAYDGVGQRPAGLEVRTDQGVVALRVTSGGAPGPDSDPQAWAGWTIPATFG